VKPPSTVLPPVVLPPVLLPPDEVPLDVAPPVVLAEAVVPPDVPLALLEAALVPPVVLPPAVVAEPEVLVELPSVPEEQPTMAIRIAGRIETFMAVPLGLKSGFPSWCAVIPLPYCNDVSARR
jgi:hypothetical protein